MFENILLPTVLLVQVRGFTDPAPPDLHDLIEQFGATVLFNQQAGLAYLTITPSDFGLSFLVAVTFEEETTEESWGVAFADWVKSALGNYSVAVQGVQGAWQRNAQRTYR